MAIGYSWGSCSVLSIFSNMSIRIVIISLDRARIEPTILLRVTVPCRPEVVLCYYTISNVVPSIMQSAKATLHDTLPEPAMVPRSISWPSSSTYVLNNNKIDARHQHRNARQSEAGGHR